MKIKMTVAIAGPEYAINAGEVTDRFDAAEAARFIAAGFAEAVETAKPEKPIKK